MIHHLDSKKLQKKNCFFSVKVFNHSIKNVAHGKSLSKRKDRKLSREFLRVRKPGKNKIKTHKFLILAYQLNRKEFCFTHGCGGSGFNKKLQAVDSIF